MVYHDGKNYDFQKCEGSFNWDKLDLPNGFIYLGHNQAPTSSERVWREHCSHPFVVGNWVVAHNGVLTNFGKLKEKYLKDHENPVDSSIIPALLHKFEKKFMKVKTAENERKCIINVLKLLKGTYGVWIVNVKSLNIYVARQGSTLFFDKDSFSSIKGDTYEEVKEGMLYKFNNAGVSECEIGNRWGESLPEMVVFDSCF